MARKPRQEVAGGVFHVYARGNNGERTFVDDRDRERYLTLLGKQVETFGIRVMAYCLMDNHIHLLVMTPVPNLGQAMQQLQGTYAQGFNRRHGRSGHLWQGRYGCVRIESDAQMWTCAAYIHLNPVNAGMCPAARDYRWSSFRATADGTAPKWLATGDLISYFAFLGGDDALQRFVGFVEGAPPKKRSRPPQPGSVTARSVALSCTRPAIDTAVRARRRRRRPDPP